MKWPWQDISPKDGKPDDYPFDTFTEMYLAWIAMMLTVIVILGILGFIGS